MPLAAVTTEQFLDNRYGSIIRRPLHVVVSDTQ